MAKQYAYTDQYGNEYPEAYCRIKEVNLNKDGQSSLLFQLFKDKKAREGGMSPVQSINMDVIGDDFIKFFSIGKLKEATPYAAAFAYGDSIELFPKDAIDV